MSTFGASQTSRSSSVPGPAAGGATGPTGSSVPTRSTGSSVVVIRLPPRFGGVGEGLATDQRQRAGQVVGLDQDVARLAALAGTHHTAGLQQVHQPARLGEA